MKKRIRVSPGAGRLTRKPTGVPYKDGEEVIYNCIVARDLKTGDLVRFKETKPKKKKGEPAE